MLNRSKFTAILLLLGVFAVGAAAGVVGSNVLRHRSRPPSYVDRLQQELALTPAQHDTVEKILKQYDNEMRDVWRSVRPRVDTMRTQIRAQIATVLDDHQRDLYRAMLARADSERVAREREASHAHR
jgi:hypothetical protein